MSTVLFVGDKPSRANWKQEVAFVGTRSFRTLMLWVSQMGLMDYKMVNSNSPDDMFTIARHEGPIVALGNVASIRITRLGRNHFKLPHPSGRNRLLNNKDELKWKLVSCKEWVVEHE